MNPHTDAQKHFRSNRKNYRIHTDIPCKVGRPGGRLLTAQVLDLSVGGMKFSCARETVHNIIPDGGRMVGLIMDVEVNVQLKLPGDSKRAITIKTGARIIHSERLAQDLFHIGVEFNPLDLNAERQLQAFIEDSPL